ncbi:MAG: HD-GYP domain-containing protein [Cetobacterium sp.]
MKFLREKFMHLTAKRVMKKKSEIHCHCERVGNYAEFIAKKMGCTNKFTELVKKHSYIHDVGKIYLDSTTLDKSSRLTLEEREHIKTHPELGYVFLKKFNVSKTAENIARYHHERWDGKGYPKGLSGEKIPLEARIVAVCDVYDALREKRVYKPGFSHEEAMRIMEKGKGKIFDPEVLNIFLENNAEFEEIFRSL